VGRFGVSSASITLVESLDGAPLWLLCPLQLWPETRSRRCLRGICRAAPTRQAIVLTRPTDRLGIYPGAREQVEAPRKLAWCPLGEDLDGTSAPRNGSAPLMHQLTPPTRTATSGKTWPRFRCCTGVAQLQAALRPGEDCVPCRACHWTARRSHIALLEQLFVICKQSRTPSANKAGAPDHTLRRLAPCRGWKCLPERALWIRGERWRRPGDGQTACTGAGPRHHYVENTLLLPCNGVFAVWLRMHASCQQQLFSVFCSRDCWNGELLPDAIAETGHAGGDGPSKHLW